MALNDWAEEAACFVGQLFGVVEHLVAVVRGQDDCGGEYGSGKAAAPCFVEAGFNGVWGKEREEHGALQNILDTCRMPSASASISCFVL